MVEDWGLHLVVKLLGLMDPNVHSHVKEDDEAEDDAECQEGAIVLFDGAVETWKETLQ